MKESLSVVIPIYNDAEVINELYKRLLPVILSLTKKYEIIFVDDGSKDNSWHELRQLVIINSNIKLVKLARNFGQQNAISAGFDNCSNDIVILMDSDLQDPPEDIPKLINALLKHDTNMAIAQWKERKDSHLKLALSKLFFKLSNNLTTINTQPQLGCFRAIKIGVIKELNNFPEITTSTLSLLYFISSNYVVVPLKRDIRYAGKSGYNLRKMISLAFSRIFSFSMVPIRIAIFLGFFAFFSSIVLSIVLVLRYYLYNIAPGWTSMFVLILFLFGLNFAFLGILGEYIGRVFLETKKRPKYIIEKII